MNPTTPPRGRDQLRERQGTPAARVAAIAFAAMLVLAGCADGGSQSSGNQNGENQTVEDASSAPPAETVTVTATAEPSPESTQESEPDPEPTPTECSPSAVPVNSDAASIAPPFPDRPWAVWQTGNLCGTLGYAELATSGGTGSSPTQLLLYNEGEFLGTGIRCNALGQVTGSTANSVLVQYRWPVGNDSNANMSGRATVTFQWNGSSVDMVGNLPLDAIGNSC